MLLMHLCCRLAKLSVVLLQVCDSSPCALAGLSCTLMPLTCLHGSETGFPRLLGGTSLMQLELSDSVALLQL
jgi:hypothetical protein